MHVFAYLIVFASIHVSNLVKNDDILTEEESAFHGLMKAIFHQEKSNLSDSIPIFVKKSIEELEKEKVEKDNEDDESIKLVNDLIQMLTAIGKLKLKTLALNLKRISDKNYKSNAKYVKTEPYIKEFGNVNTIKQKEDNTKSQINENSNWDDTKIDPESRVQNVEFESPADISFEPEKQENVIRDKNENAYAKRDTHSKMQKSDDIHPTNVNINSEVHKNNNYANDYTNWNYKDPNTKRKVKTGEKNYETLQKNIKPKAEKHSYWDYDNWVGENTNIKTKMQNIAILVDKKQKKSNNDDEKEVKNPRDNKYDPDDNDNWDGTADTNTKPSQMNRNSFVAILNKKDDWTDKNVNSYNKIRVTPVFVNRVGRKLRNINEESSKGEYSNLGDNNKPNNIHSDDKIKKLNHEFEQKMQALQLNVVNVFVMTVDRESLALHVLDKYIDLLTATRQDILGIYENYYTMGDEILRRNWSFMQDKIMSDGEQEKTRLLKQFCDRKVVCKRYPAFFDHLADLMDEVMYLPDPNIQDVLKTLLNQSQDVMFFVNLLFSPDQGKEIATKMVSLENDIANSKYVLQVIILFINNKYKIFSSEIKPLNDKVKAMRTIMDIIDQAFQKDVIEITFGDFKVGVEKWLSDPTNNKLLKPIHSFMKHLKVILSNELNDVAKNEIRILTAFVASSEMNDQVNDILKKGSKYSLSTQG